MENFVVVTCHVSVQVKILDVRVDGDAMGWDGMGWDEVEVLS